MRKYMNEIKIPINKCRPAAKFLQNTKLSKNAILSSHLHLSFFKF